MDKIDFARAFLRTPEPFIRWLVVHADDNVGVPGDVRASPFSQWLNEVIANGKPWLFSTTRFKDVNVVSQCEPIRMAFFGNAHWMPVAFRHLKRVFNGNEVLGHKALATLSAIPKFPYDFTQLEVQNNEAQDTRPDTTD